MVERRDFAALAALVREDARFSFPPHPLWYDGVGAFRRSPFRGEVVDRSRPELFEPFGLPMSFPPSYRSNQEQVNEREGA